MDLEWFFEDMKEIGLPALIFDEDEFHQYLETETETMELDQETQTMLDRLTQVFDDARNAIVGNTKLADQIRTLQDNLTAVQSRVKVVEMDVGVWRDRYDMLNEHHKRIREEKDQALAQVAKLEQDNRDLSESNGRLLHDVDTWRKMAEDYERSLSELRQEHAKALDDHKRVKGEKDQALSKLQAIHEQVRLMFPEPQDTAKVAQPLEPTAEPESENPAGPFVESGSSDSGGGSGTQSTKPWESAEGEVRPSQFQPRDDETGQFRPWDFGKTGTDND